MQKNKEDYKNIESLFVSKELDDLLDRDSLYFFEEENSLEEEFFCQIKNDFFEKNFEILEYAKNLEEKVLILKADSHTAAMFLNEEDFEIYLVLNKLKKLFSISNNVSYVIKKRTNMYKIEIILHSGVENGRT